MIIINRFHTKGDLFLLAKSSPNMPVDVCPYANKSCPDMPVHIADKIRICTGAKLKSALYKNGQLELSFIGKQSTSLMLTNTVKKANYA